MQRPTFLSEGSGLTQAGMDGSLPQSDLAELPFVSRAVAFLLGFLVRSPSACPASDGNTAGLTECVGWSHGSQLGVALGWVTLKEEGVLEVGSSTYLPVS